MLRYAAYRAAAATLPHVPHRPGYRAFALLGDLTYLLARGTRIKVRDNLRVAAGPDVDERRLRRMTRFAFRNLLWAYFELFHLPGTSLEWLAEAGTIEGMEHVVGRPEGAPGTLVVFPHSGNPEIFAQMPLLFPDERFVVVVGLMDDRRVYELMRRLRMSRGLRTVPTDEPLRLWALLRQGWHVIICGDYDSTGTGIVVELLGRPARVPRGAVKLALLTGAPLVTVESWRTSARHPHRFRARVTPVRLEGSGRSAADVRAGVERVVAMMERTFRERPEQWLAFREVFMEAHS